VTLTGRYQTRRDGVHNRSR